MLNTDPWHYFMKTYATKVTWFELQSTHKVVNCFESRPITSGGKDVKPELCSVLKKNLNSNNSSNTANKTQEESF